MQAAFLFVRFADLNKKANSVLVKVPKTHFLKFLYKF